MYFAPNTTWYKTQHIAAWSTVGIRCHQALLDRAVQLFNTLVGCHIAVYHGITWKPVPKTSNSCEVGTTRGTFKTVTTSRAPYGRGAAWCPEGIVYDTAITISVLCTLRHDASHLGFGGPEPFDVVGCYPSMTRTRRTGFWRGYTDVGYQPELGHMILL
jgi:hypothetical protein